MPDQSGVKRLKSLAVLKLYVVTAVIFFGVDVVWIGVIAGDFYSEHIGHLLASQPNWIGGTAFYTVYLVGLLVFAVVPGIKLHQPKSALRQGAMYGFFTYATFDLTCYALFVDFPAVVVVIDILWGTVLCGSVALLSSWLALLLPMDLYNTDENNT